jgi:predicted MFS family arabinose efflux permease
MPSPERFPLGALLLLALAVLVTVTAESLPTGLMPEMAASFRVDPLSIGLLISVWAITVIVTSIPLARATASIDRRIVVAVSLAVFALANVATALAPGYAFALGTRVAAAVAHGVFWAIVIVYATSLLAASHLGRGLAIVTAGGTAATVVGLPGATILAQLSDWRIAFGIIGIGALALSAVVLVWMPRAKPSAAEESVPRGGVLRDATFPAVLAFGVASVLIALAQFTSFTYIRPYLEEQAGFDAAWSGPLLLVFGVMGIVGVGLAGVLVDRRPRASLTGTLVLFALALIVLTLWPGSRVLVVSGVALWGLAMGAVFPLIQTTLMRTASERLRLLASAGVVVFFNVGIGVGSWLGGVLDGAWPVTANTAVSAVTMFVAAGLVIAGGVLGARAHGTAEGAGA